jgi:DNA-binding CsgD family transcriptional regulator
MHNRIIVIHPSEIIRLGLHSIIKSLFDIDAILLSRIDELNSYLEIRDTTILFLLDPEFNKDQFMSAVENFKKSNAVKIVHLEESIDIDYRNGNCDCSFSINASKAKIFDLLDPYLKQNNDSRKSKPTELTEREIDVLKEVALGKTNKDIAEELFISFHTVISHRKNITEKLGIKSISGLTVYAILNNLIDTNTLDPESLI